MATTKTKKTKRPAKDRHLTPVIVTASGQVVAGKRRIERFQSNHPSDKGHPHAEVVISEVHHYAMLPFLRVARDESGRLHLATQSQIDEHDWEEVEP